MIRKTPRLARLFLSVVACASTVAAMPVAIAQDFPSRPIRLLVPFGPGGITDTVARQLGKGMSEKLGQPIIIDNKPSAGHVLSMQTIAQATPDGYTLMIGSNTGFSVTPHLQKNISFSAKDFQLISPVISSPPVLIVRPDHPSNTLVEFVEHAKSQPGKINYASYGISSSAHLAMEILQKDTGINLVHVPYKGDSSAYMALMGNHADVAINSMFSAQSRIENGEVKALAVFDTRRFSSLPQVQTPSDVGSPKAGLPIWLGVFAPAGTPSSVVEVLEKSAREVVSSSEFKDFVRARGSDAIELSNADFTQLIEDESARIAEIVSLMGLQAQ